MRNMKKYDFLVVGGGLFGAVFAHEAHKKGKTCLVIDRRRHAGGNCYCENIAGINVHQYGGIPIGGYNKLTEGLLKNIDIRLGVDFFADRLARLAGKAGACPGGMRIFWTI
jgi:UDP-galactopyranose mutase